MTNNQILFSELTNNLYTYNRLQYTIKLELDKPGPKYLAGLHQASGDLLTERKFLLEAYAKADMVIFRRRSNQSYSYFWQVTNQIDSDSWINDTCQRLLSNGKWQSETERQQENLRQYQRSIE